MHKYERRCCIRHVMQLLPQSASKARPEVRRNNYEDDAIERHRTQVVVQRLFGRVDGQEDIYNSKSGCTRQQQQGRMKENKTEGDVCSPIVDVEYGQAPVWPASYRVV